jgi:ELWxxDGT repeat protein
MSSPHTRSFLLIINLLFAILVQAQPELLKDVNVGTQQTVGSSADYLTSCNGLMFFLASNDKFGRELWKSDGTANGTSIVKDIFPNEDGSGISSFFASVDNKLYFSASDTVSGYELWVTDGTEANTTAIDIVSGSGSSSPMSFTGMNGTLYFSAHDMIHGQELWKSDGTKEGTLIVKDVFAGTGSGFSFATSTAFKNVNSTLFFAANDGVHGTELWKSDGTEAGTMMVKDIRAGSSSAEFYSFTAIGNNLYFISNDGLNGQELWISDGTETGTHAVKHGLSTSGSPVLLNDEVFFISVNFNLSRMELWKTDGTEVGTILVNSTLPYPSSTVSLKVVQGELFFTSGDNQLWKTNGTSEGTSFVKQFSTHSGIYLLESNAATLFMNASDGETGQELWKSDGTEAGTVVVKNINNDGSSFPRSMAKVGSIILFVADDGINGDEIWITDGTEEGTTIVKDINTTLKYFPVNLNSIENELFFANHQSETKYEVWKSDGSKEGTSLVSDIKTGGVGFFGENAQAVNGKLLMTLTDTEHGYEIWVSDGTVSKLLKDIHDGIEGSIPKFLDNKPILNGNLFFQANDGINGIALWKTNGTEIGTVMVKALDLSGNLNIESTMLVGGVLYFYTSTNELWKTDGSTSGTEIVKTINPSHNGEVMYDMFYNGNGVLYFVASDGTHGIELWKSDGTEAGTKMVKDIHQDDETHFLSILGDINGLLILSASTSGYNYELWKSDGTETGTVALKGVKESTVISPFKISQNKDFVFFMAYDHAHGSELWKSNGTSEGTMMIKDIYPGSQNSSGFFSGMFNGVLYFSANDGVHGFEPWVSDGSVEGTKMLADIYAGRQSSFPQSFTSTDNFIFFVSDDGEHGREIWKFDPAHQTITFDPLPDKVAIDPPFPILATAFSGLKVSFDIVSGPATISENVVSLTGAGEVTIRASQVGNDQIDAAQPVERSFHVVKASQTIIFNELSSKIANDPPFDISASSSLSLPVLFSIASGPATISGNVVSLTGGGEVTIRASQAGNLQIDAAQPIEQSFQVSKATQTITFSELASKNANDPPFDISASSSSGLPVSFAIASGPASISQSTVSIIGVGNVTVVASQPGNEIYNAADDVSQSFNTYLITASELSEKKILSVYPNPCSKTLYVNTSDSDEILSLKLMNSTGQNVWEVEAKDEAKSFSIDVGDLPPGLYILNIQQNDRLVVEKIILD